MSIYVLVMWISMGNGHAIATQEFNTGAACTRAGEKWVKEGSLLSGKHGYFCEEK